MSAQKGGPARRFAAAGVAFVAIGVAAWSLTRGRETHGQRSFWYDLSEQTIYVADAELIPPHVGVGGAANDGYPAVVIAGDGPEGRRVAYLTTVTDALRQVREESAKAEAAGLPIPEKLGDRLWVTENTLVRGLSDGEWHPKGSPRGLEVIGVLTSRGADGEFPRLMSPDD